MGCFSEMEYETGRNCRMDRREWEENIEPSGETERRKRIKKSALEIIIRGFGRRT
jgi:hypothetical protein